MLGGHGRTVGRFGLSGSILNATTHGRMLQTLKYIWLVGSNEVAHANAEIVSASHTQKWMRHFGHRKNDQTHHPGYLLTPRQAESLAKHLRSAAEAVRDANHEEAR